MKNSRGFTIVELLIVIVVIGILAAIVIVAFNGVQNRANDTAVQSDLSANYKTMSVQKADTGSFRLGDPIPSMGLKFSKSSYDVNNNNIYYCVSVDGSDMALAGRSKSGKGYVYSSKNGLTEVTLSWTGANACTQADLEGRLQSYGYNKDTSTWQPWTN